MKETLRSVDKASLQSKNTDRRTL